MTRFTTDNTEGYTASDLAPRTSALGTIATQSITFFRSEAVAIKLAEANGGEAEGFKVSAAKGRAGCFVVEIVDTDDGYHLGYL